MKKICLTIVIALFVCTAALAQDTATVYRSVFGDSVTVWTEALMILSSEAGEGSSCDPYIRVAFLNDTVVVLGKRYIRAITGISINSINHIYGDVMLRESPDHSKLYGYYLNPDGTILNIEWIFNQDSTELTFMDLSLNVGDTLKNGIWQSSENIQPLIIDSVYYKNGQKHLRTNLVRRWNRTNFMDTMEFVEGVGPTWGMNYGWCHDMSCIQQGKIFHTMICCIHDSVREYHNDIIADSNFESSVFFHVYNDCYAREWHSDVEWHQDIGSVYNPIVTMYPNPANDVIYLSGIDDDVKYCVIYNSIGAPEGLFGIGSDGKIDVSSLQKGLYFMILNGNKYRSLKFIKL